MKFLLFLTLLTSIAGQHSLQAMHQPPLLTPEEVDRAWDTPHSGCCCCCICTLYVLASVHNGLKNHQFQSETTTQVSEDSCPAASLNSFITPPPAYCSNPYSSDTFAQSQFSTDLCAADESDENMPDKKHK